MSYQSSVFDMDNQRFAVANNLISDTYQQELYQVVKQLQDKYSTLQSKFQSSVIQLKDSIIDQLKALFSVNKELILHPDPSSPTNMKLNTLIQRKQSLENVLKEQ